MRLLISLLLFSTLHGLDCNLHISVIKPSDSQIKIVITHDENCTISIEDANRTIIVNSDINRTESVIEKVELTREESIVELSKSKLGIPYKRAGSTIDGFDCSGFVYYIFKEHNISIPRTSKMQSKSGETLSRDEIKIGDILSFDTTLKGHINHSGIYIGDGEFIHSSSGKAKSVTVSKLDKGFYKDKFRWGVRVK
jgi:cell wall-associated NlpC family hydrolase